MADLWKMKAEGLIRFPVLFGAKVSSFFNTFPATPSVTLNSSPNRKLQKRLAPFVGVYACVCVSVCVCVCVWKVKSQSCVWRCVLGIRYSKITVVEGVLWTFTEVLLLKEEVEVL